MQQLTSWRRGGAVEDELAAVVPAMTPSPVAAYFLAYFHTWDLVRHLGDDREAVVRLLTEHLLPADVAAMVGAPR